MTVPELRVESLAEAQVRKFIGERCTLGVSLVIPLRVLWRGYKEWCEEWGLEADAGELRDFPLTRSWAEVVGPRGSGAIRTIVRGVGLLPTASRNRGPR